MGCGRSIQESVAMQQSLAIESSNSMNSMSSSTDEDFTRDWRIACEKLGEGSYAEVYAVQHNRSNQRAAIKIPKTSIANDTAKTEAQIWKEIGKHENILNFISDLTILGRHVILMERCEYTLRQRFPDMSSIAATTTARIFRQMASSIAHLESLRIVHRDVKPDNFLCTRGDLTLKLCDFGFAIEMPSSGRLFGTYGTPFFMSPEMVGNGSHDLKTDAWSLGASFYLMLYGEAPYGGSEKSGKCVVKTIATGFPAPQYPDLGHVTDAAKDVIISLLRRHRVPRISASQALEMPLFCSDTKQFPAKVFAEGSESQSTADICSSDGAWSSGCTSLISDPHLPKKGLIRL